MFHSTYKMSVHNIQEFYILEAIKAGMTFADESTRFKRSFEKLERDIMSYETKLIDRMYDILRWYTWAACLGEARHAVSMCESYVDNLNGYGRDGVYDMAHRFNIEDNIDDVCDIFSQEWNSGAYGGDAWYEIADSLRMNVGKVTFIDHVIDLEHNSGTVLDKDNDILDVSGSRGLHDFLNDKFSSDILKDGSVLDMSPKTYEFVVRYKNIVDNDVDMSNMDANLSPVLALDIEWGDETLTIETQTLMYCDRCEDKMDEDYANKTVHGEHVCDSCVSSAYTKCQECDDYEFDEDIVEVDGTAMCQDCAKDSVTCENCGKQTLDYDTTEQGDYICDNCLASHTCDYCNEVHTDLDAHTEDTHTCEDCGDECSDLDEHKKDEHTCKFCEEYFTDLEEHVNEKHTCDECLKHDNLDTHTCGEYQIQLFKMEVTA